jgi:hypothetical protein
MAAEEVGRRAGVEERELARREGGATGVDDGGAGEHGAALAREGDNGAAERPPAVHGRSFREAAAGPQRSLAGQLRPEQLEVNAAGEPADGFGGAGGGS